LRPSPTSWAAGWRNIHGRRIYFRSAWEANWARYLEWLRQRGDIEAWEHEPTTFWFEKIKRGVRSYLPDFAVIERGGKIVYHEVKGWMDPKSATKIKRMRIYHPAVNLIVIDKKSYRSMAAQIGPMLPGWETK
jgi:hypothetical protein